VLPADEAASEGEERFVDVVAAVSADQEAAAVVEPGEGALNDPALVSAFLSRETRAHPLSRMVVTHKPGCPETHFLNRETRFLSRKTPAYPQSEVSLPESRRDS